VTKLSPKAVIFDLGSTLIEYEAVSWDELNILCAASARRFLVAQGYDVPPQNEFVLLFESLKSSYRQLASETLVEWSVPQVAGRLLEQLHIGVSIGMVDELFDAYYAPVDELLYAYPDTVSTLQRLQNSGYVIGLISNTVFPERAHRRELHRFEIAAFLKFAIFSSSFGLRKPHPGIFQKASELAGFRPTECVYIGDRYVEDILGPTAVGMPAILKIKAGREYPTEMPEATRQINHLSELLDHLQK
jgi:HAD superfamily hydrolase (TIGR01549 family)